MTPSIVRQSRHLGEYFRITTGGKGSKQPPFLLPAGCIEASSEHSALDDDSGAKKLQQLEQQSTRPTTTMSGASASADPTALVGLMPAPPDVTPDFFHTTQVQVSFITVFAVTFALATIALVLRLYTRICVVKSVGFDERGSSTCPFSLSELVEPNMNVL